MKTLIISLIVAGAQERGIDPDLALAIATVESNINQYAIGPVGEVGVFQLRPEFYLNGETNPQIRDYLKTSLDLMKNKQNHCGKKLLPTCWNVGIKKAKELGYERAVNGPYNKKIRRALEEIKKTR
jgi:hypothetical protein